ncbi:MAG: hypothetical protein GXY32_04530 [Ruminococcaceae bacterium]|nr:hypothetical protein [Oscillospiraceae bacterium]
MGKEPVFNWRNAKSRAGFVATRGAFPQEHFVPGESNEEVARMIPNLGI